MAYQRMCKKRTFRAFILGLACLLPAACAETQLAAHAAKRAVDSQDSSGRGVYKIGTPYQINGIWYYPHEDDRYREVGVGSWYGTDFHGKRTGNGEIYDMNALTAAHRTLPMPSLVRVTNLANGRSIVVRVNDRGPFANDRIIDMSRRAAQLLGFETQGTTKVQVEILAEESLALKNEMLRNSPEGTPQVESAPRLAVASESLPPLPVDNKPLPSASGSPSPAVQLKPERTVASLEPRITLPSPQASPPAAKAAASSGKAVVGKAVTGNAAGRNGIFVQAASFSSEDNAKRFAHRLAKFGPTHISGSKARNGTIYRVRVGPLASKTAADSTLRKLHGEGFRDSRVVTGD